MHVLIAQLLLQLAGGVHAPAPPVIPVPASADTLRPPIVEREFRGVWVATVNNMDWPSQPGLSVAQQQRELRAILDRAAALRMNAIIFQVRPEADALYPSPHEPWSRYLTGRQGRAPSPRWDPLAFAVAEAHARGLELHAWFNPYRAAFRNTAQASPAHISRRRPDLVVPYSQFLWMDPGLADVRSAFLRVIRDVVRRYDIDGVHIDDYFYPYPERDRAGRRIPFPDANTYAAYRRAGGTLSKSDWRRRNSDLMVRQLYDAVKDTKRWVKVGVSPFGIWRPGTPRTTTAGVDQYGELYADVRKWLHEGWLDYLTPQLYWPVEPAAQSFPVLLRWWVDENRKDRHVWPGLPLYKLPISGPRRMTASEIVRQVEITRETPGATGHVLFNARVLMDNVDRVADRLRVTYTEPALVPASPWLDAHPPLEPQVRVAADTVMFEPRGSQPVRRWIVQWRAGGHWQTRILPAHERRHILRDHARGADVVAVASVDRAGNASEPAVVRR